MVENIPEGGLNCKNETFGFKGPDTDKMCWCRNPVEKCSCLATLPADKSFCAGSNTVGKCWEAKDKCEWSGLETATKTKCTGQTKAYKDALPAPRFLKCANFNKDKPETCSCSKGGTIAFGESSWVTAEKNDAKLEESTSPEGGLSCVVASFTKDPAPESAKVCWCKEPKP